MRENNLYKEPVPEYRFTKDPVLLKKYYNMRHSAYRSSWNLKQSMDEEDIYDKISDILVVMYKDECIGGARLIVHNPDKDVKLTFEVDGFSIREILPELSLEHKCYGETSRMAVAKSYRTPELCREILGLVAKRAREQYGCEYFFIISPVQSIRFFKMMYESLGYKSTVYSDVHLPYRDTYETLEMRLMSVNLNPVSIEINN